MSTLTFEIEILDQLCLLFIGILSVRVHCRDYRRRMVEVAVGELATVLV